MMLKENLLKKKAEWLKKFRKVDFLFGMNETGIRAKTREEQPLPPGDLNRGYFEPTNWQDYLKTVTSQCNVYDVVIDVHNSPDIANCVLLNADQFATGYRNHLDRHGIPTLMWEKDLQTLKDFVNWKTRAVGLTVELNGLGFETSAVENAKFLERVLRACATIEKEMLPVDYRYLCVNVVAKREGMLFWDPKQLGEKVVKGAVLALVRGYDMQVLDEIVSPVDGTLIVGPEGCFVNADEMVFQVSPTLNPTN
jgi:predicted deacylase